MGVTYKLKDEVVHFIISQRQNNPLFSCRQLAESVAQQFGVRLSKSSVHDVLKESGIITPRGRKPGPKFQIPSAKKKQIQASLSQQIMLVNPEKELEARFLPEPLPAEVKETAPLQNRDVYEGAGKIFLKAALWDLGIFSEDNIKEGTREEDWQYYLTYTAGIKVVLEHNSSYMIDLHLPLQRSIREAADSFVNNIKPIILYKVTDEKLFKASMESQPGFKIENIALVDVNNHIICRFSNIMEYKRNFMLLNRVFVESNCRDLTARAKALFFPQLIDNNSVMQETLILKGFDIVNKDGYIVTILIEDGYANKTILQQAVENLNGMYLRDEQNKLVKVLLRTT